MQNFLILMASTACAFQLVDKPNSSLAQSKSSSALLKEDACAGKEGLAELSCTAQLAQKFAQQSMDNLRLAQESFSSKRISLAEETATENDVQPMNSWEIVLIVIGVAIGLMCVVFVAKQTILGGGAEEERF